MNEVPGPGLVASDIPVAIQRQATGEGNVLSHRNIFHGGILKYIWWAKVNFDIHSVKDFLDVGCRRSIY